MIAWATGGLASCSSGRPSGDTHADTPRLRPFDGLESPDPGPVVGPDDAFELPDAPVALTCGDGRVRVRRLAPWPGRGVQIAFELRDADGRPRPDALDEPCAIEDEHGKPWPLARAPRRAAWHGVTGLLLVPSAEPEVDAQRRRAARAFVAALPDGERVGAWVATATPGLVLLAELTTHREHVLERLTATATETTSPPVGEADVSGLEEALARVEGPWGTPLRQLVVVGAPALAAPAASGAPRPVARLHLSETVGGVQPLDDTAGWTGGASPEAAGVALATHAGAMRDALVVAGACPDLAQGESVRLLVAGRSCPLEAPEPIAHLDQAACLPAEAASDTYPYGETVAFDLTPDQRAVYDARSAAHDKRDWRASVRLGDGEPIGASVHFHGQTSIDCVRKSLTVNLDDPSARRLAPGAANDELLLISLCMDDRYYQQTFANHILAPLGLFPLDSRLVRVTLGGAPQGVYLLLEKPDDTLVGDRTDVRVVVRRRYDFDGKPEELKYPKANAEAELAAYAELAQIATSADPAAVEAQLAARMDLDGYLRWAAFQSAVHNGDWSDEAYFYASSELGPDGPRLYFRPMGWDADDLMSECHFSGKFAIDDGFGLTYCSEALLDHAIARAPAVLARYAGLLEELLTTVLAPEPLAARLGEVRQELFAHLDDDATCAAMVELIDANPAAASCEVARADIQAHMDELLDQLATRREVLLERIAAYREAYPAL